MHEQLIKELKKINIKPDPEWKQKTRYFLMSEVRQSGYYTETPVRLSRFDFRSLFFSLRFVRLAWKPVGIFALAAMFFVAGSGLVMVAAQNSNPGDTLFIAKRVIEKTQLVMTKDAAQRTELSNLFLGKRVNELQRALVQESQLISGQADENKASISIMLAVAEVKKQLDDVNDKLNSLQADKDQDAKKTAITALVLNEKIRNYKQDLKQVKNKLLNQEAASSQLDEALDQVEEINASVLEVIVDKHEKGEMALSSSDLGDKLNEHVAEIEKKVARAEKTIDAKILADGQELKEQASQAKEKIKKAKEAIAKNEFSLVLTLSRDSNDILKMLYGEIDQIVENTTTRDKAQTAPEATVELDINSVNTATSSSASIESSTAVESQTDKDEEGDIKKAEPTEQEQPSEHEVGID